MLVQLLELQVGALQIWIIIIIINQAPRYPANAWQGPRGAILFTNNIYDV